jgi:hypothetical protein
MNQEQIKKAVEFAEREIKFSEALEKSIEGGTSQLEGWPSTFERQIYSAHKALVFLLNQNQDLQMACEIANENLSLFSEHDARDFKKLYEYGSPPGS